MNTAANLSNETVGMVQSEPAATWSDMSHAKPHPVATVSRPLAGADTTTGEAVDPHAMPALNASTVDLPIKGPSSPRTHFDIVQDWEGVVEAVGELTYAARLIDRSSNDPHAPEVAELPIEDVSVDDRELLREGAIFYLSVGRLTHPSGRQDRVGRVVFRRLPGWTSNTLRRAEERAARLAHFLDAG